LLKEEHLPASLIIPNLGIKLFTWRVLGQARGIACKRLGGEKLHNTRTKFENSTKIIQQLDWKTPSSTAS